MKLIPLVLLASLSPLCTIARLWQMKEWRWDRLAEHLRHSGWGRSLFGIARPSIVFIGLVASVLSTPFGPELMAEGQYSVLSTLILLGTLTPIQFFLKKQHTPVWTKKAVTLAMTTLILTGFVSYSILNTQYSLFIPLLVVAQPFFLLASWVIWKPIDFFLKQRILNKAKSLREQYPDLTVIGITGSVGKTTTKELLAHILADHNPLVTPDHLNSELGVANWLCQKLSTIHSTPSSKLIIEMGAYKKGEISTLCKMSKPTIGVITYIGTQHVGLFGSQKAIAEAKGELFDSLPKNGHAFFPSNTPFAYELQKRAHCTVHEVDVAHSNFPSGHLHGEHNRTNISVAVAVARHLGIDEETIKERLRTFRPPKNTFYVEERNGITILNDTHNASPESMRAAFVWAKVQPHKHKVLLTPGIIEQGSQQKNIHKELGTQARSIFNRVIFTDSQNAEPFKEGFQNPMEQFTIETKPVSPSALFCCVGRLPSSIISQLL